MVKFTKSLEKRNRHNFYIRQEDKDVFKQFLEALSKDPNITAQSKPGHNKSLVSIGIMSAIRIYTQIESGKLVLSKPDGSIIQKKEEETNVKAPVQVASPEKTHLQ